jgi:Domain of unknown function (DUF4062)
MVHFIKKRLQVFVSSTYLDLRDERQAAVKAILEAGHIPAGMELFTSGDESQMEVIKQWIEDSDVYLLILGGRYGSIESNSGKSYTHLEYEYAIHLRKTVFACVMKKEYLDSKIQGSNYKDIIEQSNIDKFSEFKNLVMSKIVFQCDDIKDIEYQVMRKMIEIGRNDNLAGGWIRASDNSDSALISGEMARVSQENRELRDRIDKIESQKSSMMINGISFDDMYMVLKGILLSEEDFLETQRISVVETVEIPVASASSHNSLIQNALQELKIDKIKNVLDLLIFLSSYILREGRRLDLELLEITTIRKMRIVFEIDILEYFVSGENMIFKDVRLTEAGKLFVKNVKIQEIKRNFNI